MFPRSHFNTVVTNLFSRFFSGVPFYSYHGGVKSHDSEDAPEFRREAVTRARVEPEPHSVVDANDGYARTTIEAQQPAFGKRHWNNLAKHTLGRVLDP